MVDLRCREAFWSKGQRVDRSNSLNIDMPRLLDALAICWLNASGVASKIKLYLWVVVTVVLTQGAAQAKSRLESNIANETAHTQGGKCYDFSKPLPGPALQSKPRGEEFAGPFASWSNLKNFGAKGDGTTDDTEALQVALNTLSDSERKSPVLFLPNGTYLIKKTVSVKSARSIALIGEDPSRTVLKWDGTGGETLLHINGVSISRFDRLTFDGAGKKGILVDQSSIPNTPGAQFDTGNEYTDDIFENGRIAIRAGEFGGAAESTVLRSRFLNNEFGIVLRNFNALDWWVWDSYFYKNFVGITNTMSNSGAGNFHAFNNVFSSSGHADLQLMNTGTFNFRDNFSINSAKFLEEQFFYTNAAVTTLQRNTVITPSGNDCGGCAVYKGNMGPIILMDNTFVSPANATGPAILVATLAPPDCLSVGNSFTNTKNIECKSYQNGDGRVISIDDRTVKADFVKQGLPPLPQPLPMPTRKVFEVSRPYGSMQVQEAVDAAARYCGQRPIVHMRYNDYPLTQSVKIPARCDLQLIGDGARTSLRWYGINSAPALILEGPSQAILKDFYLNAGIGTGIEIDNVDQSGARIYMRQVQALRATSAGILVDQLDNALVESQDFQLALTSIAPASTGIAMKVIGGPLAAKGLPQSGRTNLLAGSGGANYLSFLASRGATLLVRDAWFEGTKPFVYARASDNSTVTFEGSRIASSGWASPTTLDAIELKNLSCPATLLSSAPDSDVKIAKNSKGPAAVLANNFGFARQYVASEDGSVAPIFALNRYYEKGEGSKPIVKSYNNATAALIRVALAQSRGTRPSVIEDLAPGLTDVRLYRVDVELGSVGIRIAR